MKFRTKFRSSFQNTEQFEKNEVLCLQHFRVYIMRDTWHVVMEYYTANTRQVFQHVLRRRGECRSWPRARLPHLWHCLTDINNGNDVATASRARLTDLHAVIILFYLLLFFFFVHGASLCKDSSKRKLVAVFMVLVFQFPAMPFTDHHPSVRRTEFTFLWSLSL